MGQTPPTQSRPNVLRCPLMLRLLPSQYASQNIVTGHEQKSRALFRPKNAATIFD